MASEAKITSVEFDFTVAGSARLKEFYRTNLVGAPAQFQIGAFTTSVYGIYYCNNFKGCLIFPVTELQAKQIAADLKGAHILPHPKPVPFTVTQL